VVKSADWVVDLGPEGGSGGGMIVAEGTPESVAKVPESHTGRFLAKMLEIEAPKRKSPKPKAAARKAPKAAPVATPAPRKAATKAPARSGRR
jgi:excinuclease ABC subunit A